MGLFDDLKKAANAVAKEAEKGFDAFQKDVKTAIDESPQRRQPWQQPQQQQRQPWQQPQQQRPLWQQQQTPAGPLYKADAIYPSTTDQTQRVYEIITRNFPQLEVQRNVAVNSLLPSAHPRCLPITFLLRQNGVPKVAVLLMHQKAHGGTNVKGTDTACVNLGIDSMHLYHEFENAEGYITDKIKSFL